MSNILNPDQARRFVWPDLGPICLQSLSADSTSRLRVKCQLYTCLIFFSLKKLLLCNTKLTDEGMLFLQGLVHLEVLDIDRTLVTNDGASIIGGTL